MVKQGESMNENFNVVAWGFDKCLRNWCPAKPVMARPSVDPLDNASIAIGYTQKASAANIVSASHNRSRIYPRSILPIASTRVQHRCLRQQPGSVTRIAVAEYPSASFDRCHRR
uniref:Uncharacterized protein n=1 Tax=Panagrellus redivivus TaxID=6233 RepID=A0A7E4ZTB1_PANRE